MLQIHTQFPPLQQWLCERISVLRDTCIACLVGTVHMCGLIVECAYYDCGLSVIFLC